MAGIDDLNATLAEINETTNEIADDITQLIAGLPVGGATAEQVAEVQTKVTAIATRLKGVAAQYPPAA